MSIPNKLFLLLLLLLLLLLVDIPRNARYILINLVKNYL